MSINPELQQIARLGKSRATRSNAYFSHEPADWSPGAILNPETGLGFSDDSAWNFIIRLIESGLDFRPVNMRCPPGSLGYERVHTLPDGIVIYIKVQLLKGTARGRSFHISTKQSDNDDR